MFADWFCFESIFRVSGPFAIFSFDITTPVRYPNIQKSKYFVVYTFICCTTFFLVVVVVVENLNFESIQSVVERVLSSSNWWLSTRVSGVCAALFSFSYLPASTCKSNRNTHVFHILLGVFSHSTKVIKIEINNANISLDGDVCTFILKNISVHKCIEFPFSHAVSI